MKTISRGATATFLVLLLSFTGCSALSPGPPVKSSPRPAGQSGISPHSPLAPASELVVTPVTLPSPPELPEDPGQLADELIRIEEEIRSPATPPAAYRLLGRAQQEAYRKIVANPGLTKVALDRAPALLRPVLAANIDAGQKLSSLTRPVKQIPAWRIVHPPPPGELKSHYLAAEREFGIPWQYLASIHLVESRMGRIRGTSIAGAQGPMQFLPSTWARYGKGDINDAGDAIMAAGRYLSAAGAPSSMARALYAYNHSDKYVDAVTAYASLMQRDERAFLAYYEWQVFVKTVTGDVLLQEGYGT